MEQSAAAPVVDVVVLGCLDDAAFIIPCLRQCLEFARRVCLALGTYRWNLQTAEEPAEHLYRLKGVCEAATAKRVLVEIYDPRAAPGIAQKHGMRKNAMMPEAFARDAATQRLASAATKGNEDHADYVLYLDVDEIVEGGRMAEWISELLTTTSTMRWSSYKLASWWYWREPTLRAVNHLEDSPVLLRRDRCVPEVLYNDGGRTGFVDPADSRRMVKGVDGKPMVHHYSWVRTQEQMLKKVKDWGHRDDSDNWVAKVHEEFSRGFNGTDFLKGLTYERVPDCFGLAL
jgi:hypothetical protein